MKVSFNAGSIKSSASQICTEMQQDCLQCSSITLERSKSALPSRNSSAMTQPMEKTSCTNSIGSECTRRLTTGSTSYGKRHLSCRGCTAKLGVCTESKGMQAHHLRLKTLHSDLLLVAGAALVESLWRYVAAPAASSVKEKRKIRLHAYIIHQVSALGSAITP